MANGPLAQLKITTRVVTSTASTAQAATCARTTCATTRYRAARPTHGQLRHCRGRLVTAWAAVTR
jgi:hypothetical protein